MMPAVSGSIYRAPISRRNTRISRRLITCMVAFSSVLTLVITAYQLNRDYDRDLRLIDSRMQQVQYVHLNSLVNTLWATNTKKLQIQLDGILRLPDMQYVGVKEGERLWASAGTFRTDNVISREFPMNYVHRGRTMEIGRLTVVASLDGVYQRLIDKTLIILVSNGIKTFLVAGFMLVIFQYLVTRHLDTLARYARGLDLNNLPGPLWLNRKSTGKGEPDELDEVVATINDMRVNLEGSYEALRESEERLRAVVDSIVVGVITIDERGVVQSFNRGAKSIFGYAPAEVVGENVTILMPEPHRSGHDAYVANYLRTGEAKVIGVGREVEGRRRDGSIFPMELEIGEIVVGGRRMFGGIVKDITERRQAEKALRKSEERFRTLIGSSSQGILVHRHYRPLYANRTLVEMFGYDNVEEILALDSTAALFAPEEMARLHGYHEARLRGEFAPKDHEFKGLRKDGSEIWLNNRAFRIDWEDGPAICTTLFDVTERKRAEEALRESEERFRTIAANLPGNVYRRILHPDGRITWAYLSPGLRDLMELDPDAVMERPELLLETLHPEDRARWRDALRKSAEILEPYVLEFRRITPSGKIVWLRSFARPHRRENGDVIWDGIALDITEEKEAEAQLIQASKLATLGEMASGIAHELNQPLTVIGMSAELSLMGMEEGAFDVEFVRRKLETIVGQKERMAGIINHMRLFSRKDETTLEPFNPLESVSGAVRLIGQQLHASGIELEEELPVSSRHVSGHPSQLEQVVLNLLTNARDAVLATSAASGNGSPAPRVRVSLVDDKRRKTVAISVADNGGGIPEPALQRIFDPFFTTKTDGQGTGLGLSISYSIIDAMGGRIEAENTDDGAMFRITLPVSAHGSGAVARPPKRKRAKPRSGKPGSTLPRILFVDDEPDIVEGVAEYLGYEGYDVSTAGNGWEALKLHESRSADVVITDWLMPGMGGDELIRRLRRTWPDLPIVVVTGHTTFGDDQDIVADRALVVLKKPIDLRELSEHMRQMVGRAGGRKRRRKGCGGPRIPWGGERRYRRWSIGVYRRWVSPV